jgi:hypothetical protein
MKKPRRLPANGAQCDVYDSMSENTRHAGPVNPVTIAERRRGERGSHPHTESLSEARMELRFNQSEKKHTNH